MKVVFGISLIVFAGVFLALFGYNVFAADKIVIKPPYYFDSKDAVSQVNALAFVFFFSLLAFGLSSPIALGIEAAKYASLLSTGAIGWYDLLFVLPSIVVALAAAELGQGILEDYDGKGSLFNHSKKAALGVGIAVALLLALVFARGFVGV